MKSLSPQPKAIPSFPLQPMNYNSNNLSKTSPVGQIPLQYMSNRNFDDPQFVPNKNLPITPPESRFMGPVLVRSISPTIHSNNSRSQSPYGNSMMRTIPNNANNLNFNGANSANNVNNVNFNGPNSTNNIKQRVFNVANAPRENRYKEDMHTEFEKIRQKNMSLTKKLRILEEIVGNSGLELMEQKINKLLNENKRLTTILQENKRVSNHASPIKLEKKAESFDDNRNDLTKEIEKLHGVIQMQKNEIDSWKKRWNEAENNSLNLTKNKNSNNEHEVEKLNRLIGEKNEEIEKIHKMYRQQLEVNNLKDIENNKKITILLQENDKLNIILNSQIDELDKLAFKYQELESKLKKSAVMESQFSIIQNELVQSNSKMSKILEENQFLIEKIKSQEKDLASVGILEQKIEMVVEENIKNNNLLKLKVEECDFYRKKTEEEKFNLSFLENENNNQKQIIEELKEKINILIEENKKLNETVTVKITENVMMATLEEKIETLIQENKKLNEINMRMKTNENVFPDESIIYKEKAIFLEKKNLVLLEEVEKLRMDLEKNIADSQQIGEIEMKTELLIEENSHLNNLLAEKEEEIFTLKGQLLNLERAIKNESGIKTNGN